MLPKKYKGLCSEQLENLWRAWRGLGIYSEGPVITMSLEEALFGLCVFGRYDQRLFDEALSIIITYSDLINKNKLKYLFQNADPNSMEVLLAISHIFTSLKNDTKFGFLQEPIQKKRQPSPFFITPDGASVQAGKSCDPHFRQIGWKRNKYTLSNTLPKLSVIASLNPWIKSKLIYGNTVRADIIMSLLIESNTAPEIARKNGFSQKSAWNVLNDFSLVGLAESSHIQNKMMYSLTKLGKIHFALLKPGPRAQSLWLKWKKLGHYIYHLSALPKEASPLLIESEEKRVERLMGN